MVQLQLCDVGLHVVCIWYACGMLRDVRACCTLARCIPAASRCAACFSSLRSRVLPPSAASHRARTASAACTSACSCARVASTRTAACRAARCAAASSP